MSDEYTNFTITCMRGWRVCNRTSDCEWWAFICTLPFKWLRVYARVLISIPRCLTI